MVCPSSPLERPDNPLLLSRQTLGFLSPGKLPWGAEALYQSGRIVLPGAAGAAAAVGIAAAAVAAAEGLQVAASPIDATIASYVIPSTQVAVVNRVFARPLSTLGYDAGHCQFGLMVTARRMPLPPTRLWGLARERNEPLLVAYVGRPRTTISLVARNSSTATFHVVEGWFEGFTMREDLFRQLIGEGF